MRNDENIYEHMRTLIEWNISEYRIHRHHPDCGNQVDYSGIEWETLGNLIHVSHGQIKDKRYSSLFLDVQYISMAFMHEIMLLKYDEICDSMRLPTWAAKIRGYMPSAPICPHHLHKHLKLNILKHPQTNSIFQFPKQIRNDLGKSWKIWGY